MSQLKEGFCVPVNRYRLLTNRSGFSYIAITNVLHAVALIFLFQNIRFSGTKLFVGSNYGAVALLLLDLFVNLWVFWNFMKSFDYALGKNMVILFGLVSGFVRVLPLDETSWIFDSIADPVIFLLPALSSAIFALLLRNILKLDHDVLQFHRATKIGLQLIMVLNLVVVIGFFFSNTLLIFYSATIKLIVIPEFSVFVFFFYSRITDNGITHSDTIMSQDVTYS